MVDKINVTTFANATGHAWIKNPYIIHRITPTSKIEYISKDRSLVCFVFMTFMAWGKNENVVQTAARVPINSIQFIDYY